MRTDEEMRVELAEIAEHIRPALDFLFETLAGAAQQSAEFHRENDYREQDDRAFMASFIRRAVSDSGAEIGLGKKGTNSPVRWNLGPYTTRLLLANHGKHPRAKSKRRRREYQRNDSGTVVLNVFPPDGITNIPPDLDSLEEAALTVLWDCQDGKITQFRLCWPLIRKWPGVSLDLLPVPATAEDLDITRKEGEGFGRSDSREG